jgi:hypothetical protein
MAWHGMAWHGMAWLVVFLDDVLIYSLTPKIGRPDLTPLSEVERNLEKESRVGSMPVNVSSG